MSANAMRVLAILVYFLVGLGTVFGANAVRPDFQWNNVGAVVAWPFIVGIEIGRMIPIPGDMTPPDGEQ